MIYIADCGTNWGGDLDLLKELAFECQRAGATIFKPQLWDISLYSPLDNPYYELQKSCSLTLEQAEEIYDYCNHIKIQCMFSVFDTGRLRWVQEIDSGLIKIANRMCTDVEFLNKIKEHDMYPYISVSKEKHLPYYIYENIFGKDNYKLLYTVPSYPSTISQYNLNQIKLCDGISNHIPDIYLDIASVAIGSNIIEHHVYNKEIDSPDRNTSIHTSKFAECINICNEIEKIRG